MSDDKASPSQPVHPPIDVLAIAAHRDDVEQTCGGTLLHMAALGARTAILDLTRGESGTRGSAQERADEAAAAARLLNVSSRQALDLPDGNVSVTWENKLKVAAVLRQLRPRVVIAPYWQARHPDHAAAGVLSYEAAFVAGLAKVETPDASGQPLAPWRPYKILYASLYADVRPTFVVDISTHIEQRLARPARLPLAILQPAARRRALRSPGGHPRTHLRSRSLLRPARRCPLRRALRAKRSRPGYRPPAHSRPVHLVFRAASRAPGALNPKPSMNAAQLPSLPPPSLAPAQTRPPHRSNTSARSLEIS